MDSRRNGASFNKEVADGGSVDECEETTPLVDDVLVVVGDGVSLSVEDTSVLCILLTYHQVGIIACAEVDVGKQLGINLREASVDHTCKDVEVFHIVEQIVAILVLFGEEVNVVINIDGIYLLG